MKKTRWKLIVGISAILFLGWVVLNPPGRFGICSFGFTTYGCIPWPASDVQVRADGAMRRVEKTHDLKLNNVRWLLDPVPEVLIIGIGWEGGASPEKAISGITQCQVRVLKTGEAIRLYNRLKKQGKKVAIHVHSTC